MFTTFSVLLICTAVVCIYYWVDFYFRGTVHVIKDDWYIKFQNSFPVADLWMAACAIVSAIGLLMEETWGLIFALITGSSLIFLGLMDITFNVQNNLYHHAGTSTEMKFEIFINIWAMGFGIALIACLGPRLALS